MGKLNETQMSIVSTLLETNEDFRKTVVSFINKRISDLQKAANGLEVPKAKTKAKTKAKKPVKPSKKAVKQDKKHPEAVLSVVAASQEPMTRNQIAAALKAQGHEIGEKVLNTTLWNLKKNSEKGKRGLNAEGEHGSYTYTLAEKPE